MLHRILRRATPMPASSCLCRPLLAGLLSLPAPSTTSATLGSFSAPARAGSCLPRSSPLVGLSLAGFTPLGLNSCQHPLAGLSARRPHSSQLRTFPYSPLVLVAPPRRLPAPARAGSVLACPRRSRSINLAGLFLAGLGPSSSSPASPLAGHLSLSSLTTSPYPFGYEGDEEELQEAARSNRRALFWHQIRCYISYGALSANRVPCPPRSGRSCYTHNCCIARGPICPYHRGCSAITMPLYGYKSTFAPPSPVLLLHGRPRPRRLFSGLPRVALPASILGGLVSSRPFASGLAGLHPCQPQPVPKLAGLVLAGSCPQRLLAIPAYGSDSRLHLSPSSFSNAGLPTSWRLPVSSQAPTPLCLLAVPSSPAPGLAPSRPHLK